MSNERSMILKMVEDGKINVDDAIKLLDAIKSDVRPSEKQHIFDPAELEENFAKFSNSAEGFAKDVAAKMSKTWKDVEPKVKSATKVAVEKTIYAIDKVSKSLNEGLKNLDDSLNPSCDDCQKPCDDEFDGIDNGGNEPLEDDQPKEN